MLIFCGNKNDIKCLDSDGKALYKGMKKIMKQKRTTFVVFENANSMISEKQLELHCGGMTALSNKEYNFNLILIDPNGAVQIDASICLPKFYTNNGKPNGKDKMFEKTSYSTNVTDKLFHELGEILYRNGNYERVIDYNNLARKKMKLTPRKYDEEHNRYTQKK